MTQSFEHQMLYFMSKNKRILNLFENKFFDLENFQANTVVFQTNTNASLKNLEINECKTHQRFESISHAILCILYPYSCKTHKIFSKLGFVGLLMKIK